MRESRDMGVVWAGIDGGGTRTRLALAHEDGHVFACVETGCCSFVELGAEKARLTLAALWQSAWQMARFPSRPATALFIGTGSILSAADARLNCELAVSVGLTTRDAVAADNDARIALAGALAGRPGLLLISGTGSVCYGCNAQGETWRCGGWGPLLDDAGSAHALGLAAIIATTRAADGRGEPTALTQCVFDKLKLGDVKEIYRTVHHDGVSRADIAALAPLVVAAAEAGDDAANDILDTAAARLVEMVATTARRLDLKQPELALTGGLITNAATLRRRFLDRVASKIPGFTRVEGGFPPVLGALMLACQSATGTPPNPAFIEHLRQSTANLKLAL